LNVVICAFSQNKITKKTLILREKEHLFIDIQKERFNNRSF